MIISRNTARRGGVGHEVAIYSILGFWLFYIAIVTLQSWLQGWNLQAELAWRRLIVTVAGIAMTFVLYGILRQFDDRPLTTRILVAFGAGLPCAIAIATINYYMFNVYNPEAIYHDPAMLRDMMALRNTPFNIKVRSDLLEYMPEVAVSRFFFLSAWSALYIAITFAAQTRAAERRASAYESAARQAEIRALRYQVNPHFLFNTLNSLSSLVMTERTTEAEAMIMNLSTFYRTSLSGDPMDDVLLREEVRLQRLYLDIESVRFPDRLRVDIDVPEVLMNACVPGLILQPLVENAIKYGVSGVNRPVTLTIRARREGRRLFLTVADDGRGPGPGEVHGEGIGLANVRDRLQARFGEDAGLNIETPEGGGFVVTVTMPEVLDGCGSTAGSYADRR